MIDNRTDTARKAALGDRINVNREPDLQESAKALRVPPHRLREAVQAVGDRTDDVRRWLSGRKF